MGVHAERKQLKLRRRDETLPAVRPLEHPFVFAVDQAGCCEGPLPFRPLAASHERFPYSPCHHRRRRTLLSQPWAGTNARKERKLHGRRRRREALPRGPASAPGSPREYRRRSAARFKFGTRPGFLLPSSPGAAGESSATQGRSPHTRSFPDLELEPGGERERGGGMQREHRSLSPLRKLEREGM